MPPVRVTLLSKPGCHLCDDARDAVAGVLAETGVEASVEELNILEDEALNARYWDEIPVVLIDDRVHTIWRVDPARLATALQEAAR
ncbi:glutaredoxin family protein [Antiquaquibacter soli]|uniref:Glutaredoxin family protein n=1 Tax=Antiquaquibacter soli TaxID=3064523 RepID=A0ABT9BIL2_9MICO|nr:glutaredoxin family protein [Protaetiibacter sp. WY-16]MDO7880858.1 glutaredoxin family protein [Protaetiibacter sp. WY-16]